MGKQKPISARIDPEVLEYIKGCHQPVNTLINNLLLRWMRKRQGREMQLFQEETGTDEFSQIKERHTERNNQSCSNCIYNNRTNECNKHIRQTWGNKIFCCIYWEKKKERD